MHYEEVTDTDKHVHVHCGSFCSRIFSFPNPVSVVYLILALVLVWTFGALPQHLTRLSQRTIYYVFGDVVESASLGVVGAGTRLVWVKWKANATLSGEL